MSDLKVKLLERANSKCELCESESGLSVYEIPPVISATVDNSVLVCSTCLEQIEDKEKIDVNHWHCLNASMWSEFVPVQILSYRILHNLRKNVWANDLLEQMYLDEEALKFANKTLSDDEETSARITKDSNGTELENGDSVTIIKDLVVKGAGFTAKRGTLVKKIMLTEDPEHIEGKVNGTQIYLLAKYLKKIN